MNILKGISIFCMKLKSFISYLFVLFFLSFFLFFGQAQKVSAAALTWDGGGTTNNWSDCVNWTTDVCPGSGDTVTFNGTSTKNSTVDASFTGTITSLTISSGYTGTITLARSLTTSANFSQAAGTFNGDGQILDINGTYSLTAGVFTAPSTTMSVASTFTISGSPTFNHNGGTVTFDGSTTATLSCNNVSFNLVTFAHSGSTNKTVSSNCSLPLGNNPTLGIDNLADVTLNGILSGTGTLTSGTAASGNSLILNSGSSLSGFSGLVAGAINITGATYNFGSYTIFDINSSFTISTGTVFTAPSGSATFGSTFTISSGTTFNANGGTVTFDGSTNVTLSCNNAVFNLVIFAHTAGNKTVSSNCSFPLGNNPSIPNTILLSGTLSGSGTLTMSNNQTFNAGATLSGFTGFVSNGAFTNSGATTNFGNYTTVDFNNAFTLSSGIFTAPAGTMTVAIGFTISGGTFDANGGVLTFDGTLSATLSCNNTTFSLVTFNHTSGTKTVSSNCLLPLGDNPNTTPAGGNADITLNGTLSGSGTLTIGPAGSQVNDIIINSTGALSGFSGYVDNGSTTISGATINFGNYTLVDFNRHFTLSSGAIFTAPSGTMTVNQNFTLDSGTLFNANGGTVVFDGAGATLSCNNAVFYLVVFNNTGAKTVNSNCSLPLGSNPIVTSTISLSGTLSGSGILTVNNALNLFSGAVLSGFNGISIGNQLLVIGATLDLSSYSPVNIDGNFIVSSGSFTAPSGTMSVAGPFTHSGGTFTHNDGTVVLDGTTQLITGSTTFYNLTRTTPGTLTFEAGSTQTILGTLTLKGTDEGSRLLLRSSIPGTQWNIDPQGVRLLAYLDVQDSNNINSAIIETGGTGSVDSGNNTGWNFAQNPIAIELLSPGDSAYINSERPTFIFRANSNSRISISSYKLEVDNGTWGDFQIDNIPPTPPGRGTSSQDTERDYPKYHVRYEHFEDNDMSNNYINIYTKSSNDWGSEKDHNDGKLKEGKRIWTVTGYSGAGSHALSRVLFVDKTNPVLSNLLLNNKSVVADTSISPTTLITYTNDQTPRIEGKVLDNLSAQDDIQSDRVAAGPKEIIISVKRKNILGIYELVPGQKEETIRFEELYEEGTSNKLSDLSSNTYSKYAWFAHTVSLPLPYGKYLVVLKGVDRAGNSKEYSFPLTVSSSFTSSLNVTKTAIKDNGEKLTSEEAAKEAELKKKEQTKEGKDKTYQVDVIVTDEEDKPIGGATVTLNSTPRQTTTNEKGVATFKEIEQGEHTVTIAYEEQVGEQKVVLSDDVKRYELAVKLERKNTLFSPQALTVIGVLLATILFLGYRLSTRPRIDTS